MGVGSRTVALRGDLLFGLFVWSACQPVWLVGRLVGWLVDDLMCWLCCAVSLMLSHLAKHYNFMYFLYLILFVKIEPALFLPAGTGGILNAYFFHAWWAKFDG